MSEEHEPKRARTFFEPINMEDNVDLVVQLIREFCDWEGSVAVEDRSDIKPLKNGVWLTSKYGQEAIEALQNPGETSISNVPVDTREVCHKVFQESLHRPGSRNKRNLLCTAACRGSGNSVMQFFNSYWFATEMKGIAVVITFNDDQQTLYKGANYHINTPEDFEHAAAIRILHRLYQHLSNNFGAGFIGFDLGHRSELAKTVLQWKHPLSSAMVVLRRCLQQVPAETPVLLCVDELACGTNNNSNITVKALKRLAERFDTEERLFLSVSAIGAVDMVTFATSTTRDLLLQPLGPLRFCHGFDEKSVHLLPIVLQPFFDQTIREFMPFEPNDLELYALLSKLLIWAAGYGAQWEALFSLLHTECGKFTLPYDKESWRAFVESVREWLTTDQHKMQCIKNRIAESVYFPESFNALVRVDSYKAHTEAAQKSISEAVEHLVIDCARAFELPGIASSDKHTFTMIGTTEGHCQLVSHKTTSGETLYHAYIPLAVLNGGGLNNKHLGRFGKALVLLRNSINDINNNTPERKYDFSMSTILLFTLCNPVFTWRQLCDPHLVGNSTVFDEKLCGGKDVVVWNLKNTKILNILPTLVKQLFEKSLPGVIVYNDSIADNTVIYGLFRTHADSSKVVLTSVQSDFWFMEAAAEKTVEVADMRIHEWNIHSEAQSASGKMVSAVTLSDQTIVPILEIVHCVDKPTSGTLAASSHQAVITVDDMHSWLPTAAHALQTTSHLKKIFGRPDISGKELKENEQEGLDAKGNH